MDISLQGITKAFGTKTVIQPTDLVISSGSFTTLLGPSGCGKTTLLRMLAGLETPDTGEIRLGERVVFSAEHNINVPPEQRGLGFVFQDFALWPHMTVYENVAFGLRAAKRLQQLDAKVREALAAVQLADLADRYPHQLSGGQQQRVAFARAIVIEPECILFDEPLSALDALLREQMRSELRELVSRLGITSVFVTHDQTEAMSMSDKIAVMSGGVVHQYAAPERIYAAPATEFVARFVGASNWLDAQHMFRPEKGRLVADVASQRYTTQVKAVQFLGNTYEVQLQYADTAWTILTPERLQVGAQVPVYLHASDIIQIPMGKEA